jgi:hypothetical protein
MPKDHHIRITSQPGAALDADLMAQLVIMLGRQLAATAESDDAASPDHDVTPPAGDAA